MEKIVYFAASIKGDRTRAAIFKDIITCIKEQGAKVLTEHFALDNPNEKLAELLGKPYSELTKEDIEQTDISWVDQSTHFIAEISGASTGVGRELEYARNKHLWGKTPAKILALHAEDASASAMITGMTPDRYPNVQISSYKNIEELKNIIIKFLE